MTYRSGKVVEDVERDNAEEVDGENVCKSVGEGTGLVAR